MKFNTHETTQIEAEHFAMMEHPNIERMMDPDTICSLIGTTRVAFGEWIRVGKFPQPDMEVGGGVRRVRRWYPATVFAWIAAHKKQATT